MTIPSERSAAVIYTEEFLMDLLDPKKTPRVPKDIRRRARNLLRHFPHTGDIKRSSTNSPEIWGNPELLPRVRQMMKKLGF
jgi:hypothetical protein